MRVIYLLLNNKLLSNMSSPDIVNLFNFFNKYNYNIIVNPHCLYFQYLFDIKNKNIHKQTKKNLIECIQSFTKEKQTYIAEHMNKYKPNKRLDILQIYISKSDIVQQQVTKQSYHEISNSFKEGNRMCTTITEKAMVFCYIFKQEEREDSCQIYFESFEVMHMFAWHLKEFNFDLLSLIPKYTSYVNLSPKDCLIFIQPKIVCTTNSSNKEYTISKFDDVVYISTHDQYQNIYLKYKHHQMKTDFVVIDENRNVRCVNDIAIH